MAPTSYRPVSQPPTKVVNAVLTMTRCLFCGLALATDARMQRSPTAGGFLLIAAILIGFVVGMATNDVMRGVIIGTAIGIILAVATWLIDRRQT